MRFKFYSILVLALLITYVANSQDLHFSYYQFTPLSVNPANAGAFSGSYRISGIYSDKQASVTPRPFQTFALSADAPIIRGIRKQDWIGVGIEMDLVGSSGLVFDNNLPGENTAASGSAQSWTFMKVGAAYHLSLDKKQTRILTLGGQFSNGNRGYLKLTQADARVNPQTGVIDQDVITFNNTGSSTSQDPNARIGQSSKDVTVGMLFNSRQKKSDLKLGVAVEGVLRPQLGLSAADKKYIGLNVHGAYDMTVNKKVNVIPGFYYYSLGPAYALNVNTHVSYKVNPEKDFRVIGGLGVRNLRAISLYMGGEIKDIKVGIAYDIDISTLAQASNSVGGFEICASYMGKIYKKPKPKPIIFCPRL
jgi:type IX secretion system PorP/SprF family membrane protein